MALEPVSWMDPAEELLIYRALTHGGHDAAITRAVQRTRQRLADNPDEPLAHAIAEHIGGLADDDPDALERAATQWRILSRPLCEALAREDRAVRNKHSARQQAVELLLAAHEMLERAGAERDAGRVRRALRDAGYRLRAEPLEPGRTLTPAETRVVERAAHGMTTTQIAHELFLSSHTVVSHLRSVYRKLGFNSRRELVDWWASDPAASVSARIG
jgi:DNA-binding CsgD family transcriptional regulator